MDAKARPTSLSLAEAAEVGMVPAVNARETPERLAFRAPAGDRTFAELNGNANRTVRALRARGLEPGDHLALVCSNRAEWPEVYCAVIRAGFLMTTINWHLKPDEIAYVVDNCDAKAFIADARFAEACSEAARSSPKAEIRLAFGGAIPGFDSYEEALAEQFGADIDDPCRGGTMPYTSGTTGRPKGVYRRTIPAEKSRGGYLSDSAKFRPGDVVLWPTPLYHAGIVACNLSANLPGGVTLVAMERFDAEELLRLVEQERVTHIHMVATLFHRLLALPESVKARYDLSSLRWIVHGAAPTPVHVKRALMDWLGPIVWEYYASSEGGKAFITPEEWLAKPGSVGRPFAGHVLEVRDETGSVLPQGEVGTLYFKAPATGRFEYYKDAEKTAAAYDGDFFTVGDRGYVDEDGYLFLTGRSSEIIISGGVNIYPAEIDAAVLAHPAVADVATVGVPSEEWGEEVRAVVQLAEGRSPSDDLAREILDHCREQLAHYKCPRGVDFEIELPRLPTGKIQRHRVRERYWQGRARTI